MGYFKAPVMSEKFIDVPHCDRTTRAPEKPGRPDISLVIPYRNSGSHNDVLPFTLQRLNDQSLPRRRFTIILTEQDTTPRVKDQVLPYVDGYVFGWSDRPFNRGWGLNMGFADNPALFYCCFDVDFLVDEDFFARQLARLGDGVNALRPYRFIHNLTREETSEILMQPARMKPLHPERTVPTKSVGGILIIRADFYRRIGGYVEDFEGWGYEDTLLARWVKKLGEWAEAQDLVYHLWHPATGNKKSALPNKALCESYLDWSADQIFERALRITWGDPQRYRKLLEREETCVYPSHG